jgi:hypothetical protein
LNIGINIETNQPIPKRKKVKQAKEDQLETARKKYAVTQKQKSNDQKVKDNAHRRQVYKDTPKTEKQRAVINARNKEGYYERKRTVAATNEAVERLMRQNEEMILDTEKLLQKAERLNGRM